jgi:hypothetical protein
VTPDTRYNDKDANTYSMPSLMGPLAGYDSSDEDEDDSLGDDDAHKRNSYQADPVVKCP